MFISIYPCTNLIELREGGPRYSSWQAHFVICKKVLITLLQQDLISQHVLINLDCITSIPGKTGLFTASCSTSVCTNNHCLAALDLLNRTHPTNRQKTMPKLDNRGIIAAATIGFYIPPAILTLFLLIRYALRRDAGWLWLFIFSLCM